MAVTCRSGNPGWVALAMIVCGLGCGSTQPRFGSLEPTARRLEVENKMRLFELSNGMMVALAPDKRTNLVSVDMRYQVGSAQDPPGRAGLAHLVEHLTFQTASGNSGATIFGRMTSLALTFNAYTSHDVTHYTSTALSERIDALLELEAQRLETPCARLDDALVRRERDVVLAEEAQRRTDVTEVANQIAAEVWGADHPYARPIGAREVAHASKEDACAFFDAYYVPKRAVLVVTGNLDPDALAPRIGKRFGPIVREATGKSARIRPVILQGGESKHRADVDHAVALIYLPAPAWGDPGEAMHDMVLEALQSELYALDRQANWVVGTSAGYTGAGAARATVISVAVSDPKRMPEAVEAALARGRDLFQDQDHDGNPGDNDDPDDLAVLRWIGSLRGSLQTATVQRTDAIAGRGDWLADYLTYTTHNTFMLAHMRAVDEITPAALVQYTSELFVRNRTHVAMVWPSGDEKTQAKAFAAAEGRTYDLVPWRTEIDPAEAARPLPLPRDAQPIAVDDYQFDNGLRVLMFLDPTSPVINARMVYPVGSIDDAPDRRGVADFAGLLLRHDLDREYARATVDRVTWAFGLGTQLGVAVGDATTTFSASGLGIFGDWHVWRLSWLLDQGGYPSKDIYEARQKLREIGDDDLSPSGVAFAERLYGRDHPYAAKPATVAQLSSIGGQHLAAWRRAHFATEGATLIVTGGFDPAAMRRVVAELFGTWSKSTPAPRAVVGSPKPAPGPSWFGVRMARATQVKLYVSFAARSTTRADRAARMVLAEMIEDRLRLVREGMGASYGVTVGYRGGSGGSTLGVTTALEPARAPAAAAAVMAELAVLRADAGALAADFARARRRVLTRLLATTRDATTVADELEWMVNNGLRIRQLHDLPATVANLTPAAVAAVAQADLDPARMVVSVDGLADPVSATLTSVGATDPVWFDE